MVCWGSATVAWVWFFIMVFFSSFFFGVDGRLWDASGGGGGVRCV